MSEDNDPDTTVTQDKWLCRVFMYAGTWPVFYVMYAFGQDINCQSSLLCTGSIMDQHQILFGVSLAVVIACFSGMSIFGLKYYKKTGKWLLY